MEAPATHYLEHDGVSIAWQVFGEGPAEILLIPGWVSHIDLFPTICDLLEVRHPDWLQGRSIMPVIRGEAAEIRDAVFAEGTYHAAYEPQRAIRTERWKYIRRFDDNRHPVLSNADDSASKEILVEAGWADQIVDTEQLYDLILDPNEVRNLAEEPGHANVVEEFRERLTTWMRETEDPLLDGPIPVPPGAVVNEPSQVSPNDPLQTGTPA